MGNPRVAGYDKSKLGIIDEYHKYYIDECIICQEEMWVPSLYQSLDYCEICEQKHKKQIKAKQKKDMDEQRKARLIELGILQETRIAGPK